MVVTIFRSKPPNACLGTFRTKTVSPSGTSSRNCHRSIKMTMEIERWPLPKICQVFNTNVQVLDELREKLEVWYSLQPHLPKGMDKQRLENLIIASKFSLEAAKAKMDSYYTIQTLVPEIFQDRDILDPEIKIAWEVGRFTSLPKLTPEGHIVYIFGLDESSIARYHYFNTVRAAMMVCEIRGAKYGYGLGDVVIFDCKNLTLAHLTKITPPMVKKSLLAAINHFASRIKSIHMVNAPTYMDRFIALIKPVLKAKLQQRIFTYKEGEIEPLYQFVPKAILPKDYGGAEISLKEMKDWWFRELEISRDWFLAQDKDLVNEKLRPGAPLNSEELFGFAGSFRKLDID